MSAPGGIDAGLPAEVNKQPELAGVRTLWQANSPQLFVDVDNDKARSMGIVLSDVYNTLAATLGAYYVNDFNKSGRIYTVQLQAEGSTAPSRMTLAACTCASGTGQMVPIRAFSTVRFVSGPDSVERFNRAAGDQVLWRRQAGLQLGPGDCRHGAGVGQDAAGRCGL